TEKSELEKFEKSHQHLELVIKGLLRSYDGIFDYPSVIREAELAKFLSIKKEILISCLKEIKSFGIIDYIPQNEKSQITFLENRVNSEELIINESNILKRKKAFEKRLNALLQYIKQAHNCRSKMIADYFDDKNVKQCGICDNCLRDKKIIISNEEFEQISNGIKNIIKRGVITSEQMMNELSGHKQNKVKKILNFLLEENLISVNREGMLKRKV
ncbi:MAG: RecQ family zinc-binding domain-containing protein, partial [Ginsengibacter sp.]